MGETMLNRVAAAVGALTKPKPTPSLEQEVAVIDSLAELDRVAERERKNVEGALARANGRGRGQLDPNDDRATADALTVDAATERWKFISSRRGTLVRAGREAERRLDEVERRAKDPLARAVYEKLTIRLKAEAEHAALHDLLTGNDRNDRGEVVTPPVGEELAEARERLVELNRARRLAVKEHAAAAEKLAERTREEQAERKVKLEAEIGKITPKVRKAVQEALDQNAKVSALAGQAVVTRARINVLPNIAVQALRHFLSVTAE